MSRVRLHNSVHLMRGCPARARRVLLWFPTILAASVALLFFIYFLYLADFFPDVIEEWIVGLGWVLNAEISSDLGRQQCAIVGTLLTSFLMFGITFCMIVRVVRELESERLRVIDLASRLNRRKH